MIFVEQIFNFCYIMIFHTRNGFVILESPKFYKKFLVMFYRTYDIWRDIVTTY